ncbi:MAG: invasion associated locus B family protein [Loktanella sp.]|nr:invasion associated locus B family protein [Loktanella sp.]
MPLLAETSHTFDDWAAECGGSASCTLSQTLMSDDRIWLVSLVLSPKADQASRDLALFVPQGVHLPSGIYMATDRSDFARGEWIECDSRSCLARMTINPQQEAFLKAGRSAELRYRPSPEAPVIVVDVSLMGISAGLARIDAPSSQDPVE